MNEVEKKISELLTKYQALESKLKIAREALESIARGTGVGDDGVHEVPDTLLKQWAKDALGRMG